MLDQHEDLIESLEPTLFKTDMVTVRACLSTREVGTGRSLEFINCLPIKFNESPAMTEYLNSFAHSFIHPFQMDVNLKSQINSLHTPQSHLVMWLSACRRVAGGTREPACSEPGIGYGKPMSHCVREMIADSLTQAPSTSSGCTKSDPQEGSWLLLQNGTWPFICLYLKQVMSHTF